MNLGEHRETIAQVLIVVAVCIGGWLMLVKPKADELARLQPIIDDQCTLTADGVSQQSIELAAARVKEIRARLAQIKANNRLAEDPSRFYGLVMDLASAHRVQVHALQPSAAKPLGHNQNVSAAPVHLRLAGTYSNIAEFLNAVAEIDAFIRPVSLLLAPARGGDSHWVEADFGCELLSFATHSVEAAGGDGHAQR